mgnify:CR=1 FL=1
MPHAERTPWVPSKYAEGERRYGRDALNNTSCECVVAKANEADCLANAEVQTREEGGILILEYTTVTLVEEEIRALILRSNLR